MAIASLTNITDGVNNWKKKKTALNRRVRYCVPVAKMYFVFRKYGNLRHTSLHPYSSSRFGKTNSNIFASNVFYWMPDREDKTTVEPLSNCRHCDPKRHSCGLRRRRRSKRKIIYLAFILFSPLALQYCAAVRHDTSQEQRWHIGNDRKVYCNNDVQDFGDFFFV